MILGAAIRDCNEAIRLKPDYAAAYLQSSQHIRAATRAIWMPQFETTTKPYGLKPDSAR